MNPTTILDALMGMAFDAGCLSKVAVGCPEGRPKAEKLIKKRIRQSANLRAWIIRKMEGDHDRPINIGVTCAQS